MRPFPLLVLAACGGLLPVDDDGPSADDPAGDTDGPSDVDTDGADTDVPDTEAPDTDDAAVDDSDPADSCACDDGDPCTTDTCGPGGACVHLAWDGDPLSLWDLASVRDPSTLDLQVVATRTVRDGLATATLQELRYTSWQSDGCVLSPVRIEAFLAVPSGRRAGSTGALVVAHGLGGAASETAATGPAFDHGLVTLAFSGPGQGASEGWGSVPDHLFDVDDVPRDSWFWEHATAAMRGITVLEGVREVDPDRIGVTGYSGGAVATLVVNGVDPRVAAAVPVSGVGHLDLAARNDPPGWEVELLAAMTSPATPDDPAWTGFEASLDPRHFLATAHGPTLVINGLQDEFFPVTSTAATYAGLRAASDRHRLTTVHDWDHGWFGLFDTERPLRTIDEATANWLALHLGRGGVLPPEPAIVDVVDGWCAGPVPCVIALVAWSPGRLDVVDAQVRFSVDGLGWLAAELRETRIGWVAEIPWTSTATIGLGVAAWVADVEVRDGLLGPRLRVSSPPRLPPGFQPDILPISGPLP